MDDRRETRRDAHLEPRGDALCTLAEVADGYTHGLKERPQDSAHFGIAFTDRAAWEERVDAIRHVSETHPHLARRLVLSGVFPLTPTLHQAFVWTDVFAAGVITFGQHIELQWQAACRG
jgi:hypothetical protein